MMRTIFKHPVFRIGVIACVAVLGYFFLFGRSARRTDGSVFIAKRGPLQISVLEGGSLEALESQEVRSQIKGFQGTKILNIVEEGYQVTEEDINNGKVLVEMDSSDLVQRITTEEIQFQSTLSALIEAQQAYDIQANQNKSDLKAAEQKARFALMDFEKFLGKTNTQDVINKLNLHLEPFTNDMEQAELALSSPPLVTQTDSSLVPFSPSSQPNDMGPRGPRGPGIDPAEGNPGAGSADGGRGRPPRRSQPGQDMAAGSIPEQAGGRAARGPREMPAGGMASARDGMNGQPTRTPPSRGLIQDFTAGQTMLAPPPVFTNRTAPIQLVSKTASKPSTNNVVQGTGTNVDTTFAPAIDFTIYATNSELLGDGAAKQSLRKLKDDQLLADSTLKLSKIHLEGTKRLFTNDFVTKDTLDSEQLTVNRNEVQVAAAVTALDLFIKYEFTRTAEDFLSKYDEALRSLERARKEAVSKMAQARARLMAADGRYRIECAQRQELKEQLTNCVIRAKRQGLVVYGGSDDNRFRGEEQIREGATIRERQSIITIPDMTHMSVKVKIHESHIKKIKKGLKARIQVDAFPDEKLTGEVIKVGVLPDSGNRYMNPDLKVYITSVSIDGVRDWLKPGMSAKAEILVKELPDVIYIPLQAVVPLNGKQVCFIPNGGQPEQRVVEVGEFNDEFIEIKKGIKEGEKVLLRAPEGTETEQIQTDNQEEIPGNGVAKPAQPPAALVPPAGNAKPVRSQGTGAGPGSGAPRQGRPGAN